MFVQFSINGSIASICIDVGTSVSIYLVCRSKRFERWLSAHFSNLYDSEALPPQSIRTLLHAMSAR